LYEAVRSARVKYDVDVVGSLQSSLEHTANAGDQVGMMNVLSRLELVDIDVSSLRNTGIGKVVRRLSEREQGVHDNVKLLASRIVVKWRAMVKRWKSHGGDGGGDSIDAGSIERRDRERRAMSKHRLSTLAGGDVALGDALESSLFQRCCSTGQGGKFDLRMYASHLKQIVANLRLNGDLLSRLCAGALTSDELVSMTPEEMATREKKRKRQTELEDSELGQFSQWKQQIKGQTKNQANIITGVGACPRCKHEKVFVRHIPDHTSMAGVASRKPNTMAICAECETQWPIE
jgi:hypothetical protein